MKQKIEIEVPEGKKAVWDNNQIKFVDAEPYWKSIKTFEDAYWYCYNYEIFAEYIAACNHALSDTYEEKIAKLRLIIVALTNNEKLSLVRGNLYYPVIQFCAKHNTYRCSGNKIIGKIKLKEEEYLVVGGSSYLSSNADLGYVGSYGGLANTYARLGLLQVSSKEIAKHLSTYFGKLIFEIMYGGSNYDWEWVE